MDTQVEQSVRAIVQETAEKVLGDAVTGKDPEAHALIRKMMVEIIEEANERKRAQKLEKIKLEERREQESIALHIKTLVEAREETMKRLGVPTKELELGDRWEELGWN